MHKWKAPEKVANLIRKPLFFLCGLLRSEKVVLFWAKIVFFFFVFFVKFRFNTLLGEHCELVPAAPCPHHHFYVSFLSFSRQVQKCTVEAVNSTVCRRLRRHGAKLCCLRWSCKFCMTQESMSPRSRWFRRFWKPGSTAIMLAMLINEKELRTLLKPP